ncbi:MAG TPA: glycosyltransferase family 1 protein [Candidatus Saccharimonadaceae bacterium]|nr:glycosyltransferase family 1 protein [Candidatus Saccharimonadaceae bacterium]
MKIAYDARFFPVNDKFDGVGRYSYELAQTMAMHSEHDFTWLISDPRQVTKLPTKKHLLINRPDDMAREFRLPRQLNSHEFDIVYSPFYLMGAGRGKRNYKLVLTIHDLTYFHYRTPPQWLPAYQRAVWWLFNSAKWPTRWLLHSADAIATVSATAGQELAAWHMTSRPITPVLNAVSAHEGEKSDSVTEHYSSHDIIYMGAFTPYKNVELLIDAMAALPDCTLHLLSRVPKKRRSELEQRARAKGVRSHIIFHDGVSDDEYHELLESARCLVTAAKTEGFGLPILEAQSRGVPVACSDTPIFHEVAGDAALYFDPASPTACAEAIRALADATTSQGMITKGLKNATRFHWSHSADTALKLCADLTKIH